MVRTRLAFPFCIKQNSGMEHLAVLPTRGVGAGDPYSYGDSAGVAPDFPFNSASAVALAKTNYGANVGEKKLCADGF